MCFVLIIDICSKQQISHKLRLTQYNQKEIKKIEIHMRDLIIVCYIIWQKCMIFSIMPEPLITTKCILFLVKWNKFKKMVKIEFYNNAIDFLLAVVKKKNPC